VHQLVNKKTVDNTSVRVEVIMTFFIRSLYLLNTYFTLRDTLNVTKFYPCM